MNSDIRGLVDQVKPYLRQYLIDCGVQVVKKGNVEFFRCIDPNHPDRDPSAGFVRDTGDEIFHCFSCCRSGNILTAAHLLENKPLHGAAFIRDNLEYLLQKYNIEYSIEWSEEQLEGIKVEGIYEEATRLLTVLDSATGDLKYSSLNPAKERGWLPETCRKMGIATVQDFDAYLEILSRNTGLPQDELAKYGIKSDLFGPDYITISIRDHKGVVRGYVARYLHWKKGSEIPKYKNTSVADNPGYQKEKILFCLDLARKYNSLRLDIFEGYGSAIVAHQNNYHNSVAIGSTAFTDQHIQLIKELGFQHINFVLDQDATGSDMMEKYMEKFGGHQGLQVTITNLPFTEEDRKDPGQNDPDYYIRKYGINEYRKLKPIGVFEHMLSKHAGSLDAESNPVFTRNFARQMIPLIVNQPDAIERSAMISTLARVTAIDKEDIRDEIRRIEQTDIRNLKDELVKKLKNASDPDSLKSILAKSISSIDDTSTKDDRYLRSVTESIEIFDSIFTEMNSIPEGIHGWRTGFEAMDMMLDGIPKPTKGGIAIGFAGAPQHSKSAVLMNLAANVAKNNDDVAICYWAIDDHRKTIANRLIAMLSGVHIKKVLNQIKRTAEDERLIRIAQDQLRELTYSRRLVFKDDKYGRTKAKAEYWLKETQDVTGKNILFCVDSLHNVLGDGESETRVKILTTSMWLKSLCASMPATIMTSIELIKNKAIGQKPTLMAISESGKVEYDFDTVAIVWNEAQGNYLPVDQVGAKWGIPGNYKPVIELDFQKNKSGSGQKGSLFLKFDTDTTAFVGCMTYQEYMALERGPSEFRSQDGQVYRFDATKPSDAGQNKTTKW